MVDNTIDRTEEITIDVQRLFNAVLHKLWLVVLSAVLCAGISFLISRFLITPQYESSAMFYVNNNSLSVGDASFSLSTGDISAAKSLVDSYIVILNTRTTLNDVIDYAGIDRTSGEVREMISATSVDDTEIFQVVVTSTSAQEAEKIANAITYILPKRISTIIDGTSAEIVDHAIIASRPSSPSYTKNTMIGFALGIFLSIAYIVLYALFDITIRNEDDITQICKHPILASVPDMLSSGKESGYYRYNNDKTGKTKDSDAVPELIGGGISFAASEAYKLLRTKLQFSFAGESSCRVIGVSSAMAGEGKSLSSINLAHSLSQLDKRVLLIDCDMRRPSVAGKLYIEKKAGLSSYLSGQSKLEPLIQKCGIKGDEDAFSVLSAGRIPPNPIELLSSPKMEELLSELRASYDYVILDLPPVGEVSDAMAIAKQADGMLLVIRQNYCNRHAVNAAINQFDFIGAKILGVIYNCASEPGAKYGKKYYKKYYRYSPYEAEAGRRAETSNRTNKK